MRTILKSLVVVSLFGSTSLAQSTLSRPAAPQPPVTQPLADEPQRLMDQVAKNALEIPNTKSSAAALPAGIDLARLDISRIIRQVKSELGLDDAGANRWLSSHVADLLSVGDQDMAANAASGKSISVRFDDGTIQSMVISADGSGFLVYGNEMALAGTVEAIEAIRNSILRMTEVGISQVVVRTLVFKGPLSAIKQLPIRWAHVATTTQLAVQPSEDIRSAAAGQSTAAARLMAGVKQASFEAIQERASDDKLVAPDGVQGNTWVNATAIIERATPVLYTLLAPDELANVTRHAQKDEKIERVSAPGLTVFNGRSACINTLVERPFVTSVASEPIEEHGRLQVTYVPQTRIYHEGSSLTLRPRILHGDQIRLRCSCEEHTIRDVKTLDFPAPDGSRELRVQLPEVGRTQFQTQIDMPVNFALAISTADTGSDGEEIATLTIIHCAAREVPRNISKVDALLP